MEEKLKIFWEDVKDNSPAFFKNFSKDATKIIKLFILHLVSEGSVCTAIITPAKGGRIMLSSEGFLAEFNTRVTIKDNVALLV